MRRPDIILASGSASRRQVLANAGIEARAVKPNVDEEALKADMRRDNVSVGDQAMHLAEVKAIKVSAQNPGLVIAGDQMLNLDGAAFELVCADR
ncbi:MAG: Maf family protein [Pseudomonadota bacterium]